MKVLPRPHPNIRKADPAAYPRASSTPKTPQIYLGAYIIPRSTSSATVAPATGHVGHVPDSKTAQRFGLSLTGPGNPGLGLDHIALDRVGVVVGERDLGHVGVDLGLVADDDRYTVRVVGGKYGCGTDNRHHHHNGDHQCASNSRQASHGQSVIPLYQYYRNLRLSSKPG